MGPAAVSEGQHLLGGGVFALRSGGAQVARPRPQPFLRRLRSNPLCWDCGPDLQALHAKDVLWYIIYFSSAFNFFNFGFMCVVE